MLFLTSLEALIERNKEEETVSTRMLVSFLPELRGEETLGILQCQVYRDGRSTDSGVRTEFKSHLVSLWATNLLSPRLSFSFCNKEMIAICASQGSGENSIKRV